MYLFSHMTILLPTIPVTDLQRSTKRVLENLRPWALVQSHGRTKGLLLSAELGERLLTSGLLEGLLEIPTDGRDMKSLTEFSSDDRLAPTHPLADGPLAHQVDDHHPGDVLGAAAELFVTLVTQDMHKQKASTSVIGVVSEFLRSRGWTFGGSSLEAVHEQLLWLFPKAQWEEQGEIIEPYQALLSHLVRVFADSNQMGALTPAQAEAATRHLLSLVAVPR